MWMTNLNHLLRPVQIIDGIRKGVSQNFASAREQVLPLGAMSLACKDTVHYVI